VNRIDQSGEKNKAKGVFKINLAAAKIIQLKVPNTQLLNGFDEPSKTVIFIATNKIKVVYQAYLYILNENIQFISDILVGNLDPLLVITDSSVSCMCVNWTVVIQNPYDELRL